MSGMSSRLHSVGKMNMQWTCILVYLLAVALRRYGGWAQDNDRKTSCVTKETCSACMREIDCSWCAQPDLSSKSTTVHTRCLPKSEIPEKWCSSQYVIAPSTSMAVEQDLPLRPARKGLYEAVQIRPQRLRASLRVGEEIRIPISYQQAEDYPVDLYYLMDLSASMADDKDKLSVLGNTLATVMKNITNNFKLGFGSFVDKTEMPFTNTVPSKLRQPCTLPNGIPCAPPYAFKNHLSLTEDTIRFSQEVNRAPVSGNLDSPEGGFDAIMQSIVCRDIIGWRQKARHLLVFSTDAGFHLAGDGKLAGIVEKNDCKCHMENGFYTMSSDLDYPSVGQINEQATEHNINIIFAVTKNQGDIYKLLKNEIKGASYGTLSGDSSNVVDLVRAEYDKIVDSVTLTDNAGGAVEIKYFSRCLGSDETETHECTGLKGRTLVEFTAVIKVLQCPDDPAMWSQTINIKPGSLNESVTVDIQLVCDCECERPGYPGFEQNSPACSSGGDLRCGVCACDDGRYGKTCECDGAAIGEKGQDEACRENNSTDAICSGLGSCRCGKCDCHKRPNPSEVIYGSLCECDNFSCKRSGGALCSGVDRGHCDCGKCQCKAGWSGAACECRDTNSTCIAPDSEDVCDGHGECVCGVCQCSLQDTFRYSGRYCEECPSCAGQRCEELRPCVECLAHQTGEYDDKKCTQLCSSLKLQLVDEIHADLQQSNGEKFCLAPDQSGCTMKFAYWYDEATLELRVKAQRTKECAAPVDVLAVVLGLIGSILLAGLIILLIWKVLTHIHDRREYAKFAEERDSAAWGRADNPLYRPSTTTFQNPAFQRKSVRSQ